MEKQTSELERLNQIGEELNLLQSKENDGRGVIHLTYVVSDLRRGDIETARANVENQSDKFGDIPHIKQWVVDNLFEDIMHPWELEEDFIKRLKKNKF